MGDEPILVPFFDDGKSYWHLVLGAVARMEPSIAAPIALAYLLYQMSEVEPLPNKIGDFAEFATGWLSAEIGARI